MTATPERIAACLAACEGIPTEDLEGLLAYRHDLARRLHQQIMALPGVSPAHEHAWGAWQRGHRDARHAAAELVNEVLGANTDESHKAFVRKLAEDHAQSAPACLVEAIREARDCEPPEGKGCFATH
jgi:hypothetical protein